MSLRHGGTEGGGAPERVPASAVMEGPVPVGGLELGGIMGSMVKSESSAVVVQLQHEMERIEAALPLLKYVGEEFLSLRHWQHSVCQGKPDKCMSAL